VSRGAAIFERVDLCGIPQRDAPIGGGIRKELAGPCKTEVARRSPHGCGGADLAWVAADVSTILESAPPWDLAAGILLVRGGGRIVTDLAAIVSYSNRKRASPYEFIPSRCLVRDQRRVSSTAIRFQSPQNLRLISTSLELKGFGLSAGREAILRTTNDGKKFDKP